MTKLRHEEISPKVQITQVIQLEAPEFQSRWSRVRDLDCETLDSEEYVALTVRKYQKVQLRETPALLYVGVTPLTDPASHPSTHSFFHSLSFC